MDNTHPPLPQPVRPGERRRVSYTLRLRSDLLAEIDKLARAENRSRANWIEIQLLRVVAEVATPVALAE